VGWIVKGKELSQEEYEEYRKKDWEEKERTQDEIQRRINEVGEAFRACREFIEQHPEVHYNVRDAQAREHAVYQKLRQNLERADTAPRCEKVREDGTVCGSPQMKGYRYCYTHERMLQTQSQRLQLPALEDANGIQMAIMRVQKALIDDEITEKKAGLLLYSLQMASSNLKHTTFTSKDKSDVVTEMRESPISPGTPTSRVVGKSLPLINADNSDENHLPRINADERGSKPAANRKRLPKLPRLPESPEINTKTFTTEVAEEHRGKGKPQPGAAPPHQAKSRPAGDPGAVPHEHRVG
jgi:hypothetical protein